MSGKQQHRKRRGVPAGKPPATKPAGNATDAMLQCITAQEHLVSAQELSRSWEGQRRAAIRQAFTLGVGTAELSAALGISRAKIYQLIGSTTRSKTD